MSAADPRPEDEALQIDGRCPECGAPFRAGIWDHSFGCEFCGSLLVSARELNQETFVAGETGEPLDVAEMIATREARDYRSTLVSRFRAEEGVEVDLAAFIEPKVRAFRAELLAELVVRETIDFFVPYEIHEQTVAQGILGRRGAVKESFVQAFEVEQIERSYDAARYMLRDRGLKLHGFHLQLISDANLTSAQNRFLELTSERADSDAPVRDASKVKPRAETKVITMLDRTVRERHLRVFKHMTYACVERIGQVQHLLIDRQFGAVAGVLQPDEVETFRSIPAIPTASVFTRPEIHAIASECPNCGWELELPRRERIVFCPTCALGIAVTPKGLESVGYRVGLPAPAAEASALLYFPFWAFELELRVDGQAYRRLWDWLELVSPQDCARQFCENDPEQGLLYVPARGLYGTPELDNAFAQLAGWSSWCQPTLLGDRPAPDPRATRLGVDLDAEEARELARFVLLTLHDVGSTRRLNAANFRRVILDAELELGPAQLVSLPLPIQGERWMPPLLRPAPGPPAYRLTGSTVKGLSRSLLEKDFSAQRLTRRLSLY